jgi:hypothetical protein
MLILGDLIGAGLEALADDPTGLNAFVGRIYRNTTTGQVRWYTGTAWKNVVSDGQSGVDVSVLSTTTGASSATIQVPQMTTAEKNALVSPVTGRIVYDSTLKSLYVYNGTTWIPAGGGSALTAIITQASHGFVSTDIGCALYINGSGVYTKARSDAANTAEVVGLLYSIVDANTFNIAMAGEVTVDSTQTGGAMTVGENYYLSPTTAGRLTATEPTTVGHVSLPIGVAKSATVLVVNIMRGVVVGGANVRTSVGLANNATTTVQSFAAYEAGELTGWVTIAATTPLKFYLQAQVAKNGAGTDYNVAWQATGDTYPVGFNVTITAAGLLQVTLPNLAGFTSASSINYALNAPAVGTTFPLSINQSSVIGRIQTKAIAAEAYASSGGLGTLVTTLFNNLTIGNTYKVSGGIASRSDSGNSPISVKLACNGADVIGGSGYTFPTYPAAGTDYTYPIAVTFTATGTTLSVYAFGSNTSARIRGGSLTIEEVSPNSITTAFT